MWFEYHPKYFGLLRKYIFSSTVRRFFMYWARLKDWKEQKGYHFKT